MTQDVVGKLTASASRSAKNAIATSRSVLLGKLPLMLEALEGLATGQEQISDNATSEQMEAFRAKTQERKVQLTAVNSWLDRAGVIPPKAQAERSADMQLAEMTVSELRRLADTLDGEIAERAKVVTAPVSDTLAAPSIEDIM